MLAMVADADSQVKAGEKPDWNLCRELAVCGDPVWADYSDVLASFAENFGAGEGGPELEEAVHFVDTFGPTKQLGEKLWRLLGEKKMSRGPLNQIVVLRYAMIKATLLAMDENASTSTLFAQPHITKLTCDENKEKTLQAG